MMIITLSHGDFFVWKPSYDMLNKLRLWHLETKDGYFFVSPSIAGDWEVYFNDSFLKTVLFPEEGKTFVNQLIDKNVKLTA